MLSKTHPRGKEQSTFTKASKPLKISVQTIHLYKYRNTEKYRNRNII